MRAEKGKYGHMRTNMRLAIVQIEVVLVHPALLELQMRTLVILAAVRDQNASGLAGLEDGYHLIRFGLGKIRLHKLISPLLVRVFQYRRPPFSGSVLHPVLELVSDFAEVPPGHPLAVAVCVKEAQDPFRLLERLNDPVQQQSIKTPIPKSNAILVMLVEGVHKNLQLW
jgi:hypothetical protein